MASILTKTGIQKLERRWRRFVMDSRFTRFFFWSGVAVFVAAIFTPQEIRVFMMERVFCIWLSSFFLYFASAFALTTLNAFIRRDLFTAIWMAAWTCFIGGVGYLMLRFGVK